MQFYNKPCAAHGLESYRYRGRYGWIMIGALNDADALNEARRSVQGEVSYSLLQFWNGNDYTNKLKG